MPAGKSATAAEKLLLRLFRSLSKDDRKTLLDLAEFFAQRADGEAVPEALPEPQLKEGPADESVVLAIKRLSSSYYMLDRSAMLNETSALMAQHIMQGRDAAEVIAELETLFASQYEKVKKASESDAE